MDCCEMPRELRNTHPRAAAITAARRPVRLPHDCDWEPFVDGAGRGGATLRGPSSTLPRREETPPARILYLEADPAADRDQTAAVSELLEAAGYRMLCGHPDDFDGIDLARGADLLLVDLPPAAGSARDLLRPFWTDPAAAAVPVIFITADPRAPAHAVSAGGSDHLTRPVEPQLLLATVAARLASQRALHRLFAPAG